MKVSVFFTLFIGISFLLVYILANNNDNDLYYDATFLEDGGFIVKEFNQKERIIRLLKFN